jgi:hypothetical protein
MAGPVRASETRTCAPRICVAANLSDVDLTGAGLSDANLTGADLRSADLQPIRADFYVPDPGVGRVPTQ